MLVGSFYPSQAILSESVTNVGDLNEALKIREMESYALYARGIKG